ncbi:MAG: ATP-binding protein [Bacteroidales bacterium]|nr:ATP-binding protein [Bacteroidales bacterium]
MEDKQDNSRMSAYISRLKRSITEKVRFRPPSELSPDDVFTLLHGAYLLQMRSVGITTALDDVTVDKIQSATKWLINGKYGLILQGVKGTGKTTLAFALMEVINALGYSVYEDERHQCYSCHAKDLERFIKDDVTWKFWIRCECLVIDDPGATDSETVKVWGNCQSPFVEMINYRYSMRLLTIITTNLTDEQLLAKYGERTTDRLKELCDKIVYKQRSYRK